MTTFSLNAFDDGSESSTATLCSTKAFSEQLAFVEVLAHTVMMLHSDQEPMFVQLLKTVQNRRPIETSAIHGPRISHQSQSKIENANQVSTTLENLLREKPSNHASSDGRTALLCVSGKACTSQLPFGERVVRKRKAKEVQEFEEFKVKMKVVMTEARMTPGKKVWSKWVETRKDPNKLWYESSGLSPREGSTQSKSRTKCTKRCGRSSGYFGPHPRQRSLQHVHLASANFADLKAWRNSDTISFYVVPPEELRRKRKIWRLVKNRGGNS